MSPTCGLPVSLQLFCTLKSEAEGSQLTVLDGQMVLMNSFINTGDTGGLLVDIFNSFLQ